MSNNKVVMDTIYSLNISHTWRCNLKLPQVKQLPNPNLSAMTMPWRYHQGQQKNYSLGRSPFRMEQHNMYYDTIGEIHGYGMSADFTFSVNNNWRASISKQNNGITILIKKISQFAEFSVVIPEQSMYLKPADMAILSMNPQGDPDLTAYLN